MNWRHIIIASLLLATTVFAQDSRSLAPSHAFPASTQLPYPPQDDPAPTTDSSITLYPIDDAAVLQSNPDTNYGSSELLAGYYDGGFANSFIKFDPSALPPDIVITSAQLRLTAHMVLEQQSHGQFFLLTVQDPWDEDSVTWNNQPGFDLQSMGSISVTSTPQTYTIDLPDISVIQEWYDDPSSGMQGIGLFPLNIGTSAIAFGSKENGTSPRLKIYYEEVATTGSLGVRVSNVPGGLETIPGDHGHVQLYRGGSQISSQQLIAAYDNPGDGIVTFGDLAPADDYEIRVFHQPVPATIYGEEHWGRQQNLQVETGTTSSAHFVRNMPYVSATRVYAGGDDVTHGTVVPGTPLTVIVTLTNPSADALTASVSLTVDRDTNQPYDHASLSPSQTVGAQASRDYSFSLGALPEGTYFDVKAAITMVPYLGSNRYTDGTDWYDTPLIQVAPPETYNLTVSTSLPDGSPLSNVERRLYRIRNESQSPTQYLVSTNYWTFHDLDAGNYTIEAFEQGIFLGEVSVNLQGNANAIIQMPHYLGQLPVKIVKSDGQQPVQGANVVLYNQDGDEVERSDATDDFGLVSLSDIYSTITDDHDGVDSSYEIKVFVGGALVGSLTGLEVEADAPAQLQPLVTITTTVAPDLTPIVIPDHWVDVGWDRTFTLFGTHYVCRLYAASIPALGGGDPTGMFVPVVGYLPDPGSPDEIYAVTEQYNAVMSMVLNHAFLSYYGRTEALALDANVDAWFERSDRWEAEAQIFSQDAAGEFNDCMMLSQVLFAVGQTMLTWDGASLVAHVIAVGQLAWTLSQLAIDNYLAMSANPDASHLAPALAVMSDLDAATRDQILSSPALEQHIENGYLNLVDNADYVNLILYFVSQGETLNAALEAYRGAGELYRVGLTRHGELALKSSRSYSYSSIESAELSLIETFLYDDIDEFQIQVTRVIYFANLYSEVLSGLSHSIATDLQNLDNPESYANLAAYDLAMSQFVYKVGRYYELVHSFAHYFHLYLAQIKSGSWQGNLVVTDEVLAGVATINFTTREDHHNIVDELGRQETVFQYLMDHYPDFSDSPDTPDPIPDVAISSLSQNPTTVTPGDVIDFRLGVTNIGSANAGSIQLTLHDNGGIAWLENRSNLSPGETVYYDVTWNAATGDHTLEFSALVFGDDADLTNNFVTRQYHLAAPPAFSNHRVQPDSDWDDTTPVSFFVTYSGTPPDNDRVIININGANHDMEFVSGNYADGAEFGHPNEMLPAGSTIYYFMTQIGGEWIRHPVFGEFVLPVDGIEMGPEVFSLLTPEDDAVQIGYPVPFSWQQSSDPDGGAVTYELWHSEAPDFSSAQVYQVGQNVAHDLNSNMTSNRHYWKVIAEDDEGSRQRSWQIFQFLWQDQQHPPVLSWSGRPGFENGAVAPMIGEPLADFDFEILFSDDDGNPPGYGHPRVHITHGGVPISGSPFAMAARTEGDFTTGRVYGTTVPLPAGTEYDHRIECADEAGVDATGIGAETHFGPVVLNAANLLLTDTFSDGDLTADPTWTDVSDPGSSVAVIQFGTDAALAALQSGQAIGRATTPTAIGALDFNLRFSARGANDVGTDASIDVRLADDSGHDAYRIRTSTADNMVFIESRLFDDQGTPQGWSMLGSAATDLDNGWHTFKLERRGSLFGIKVDGLDACGGIDTGFDAYHDNLVSISVASNGGDGTAYDDLVLWTESATVLSVLPDGSGDHPHIQAAIDAAPPGGVIELANGTYSGDGNRDLVFRGKPLVIRSQSGNPLNCTISIAGTAAEPHRGFELSGIAAAGCTLQDLTIRGADNVGLSGAAISCTDVADLMIRNCRFMDLTSSAADGGAVAITRSTVVFENCSISAGSAETNGSGVGIFQGSSVEVRNCDITSIAGGGLGGAFYSVGSQLELDTVLLAGDLIEAQSGAAIYAIGGDVTAAHCTIVGAQVADGGMIQLVGSASLQILDSIIAFGDGVPIDVDPGCTVVASFCDVFGNTGGDFVAALEGLDGVSGNFAADPVFCDQPAGVYSLASDSPCLSAGSGGADIGARAMGCGYAAGAFEFVEIPGWIYSGANRFGPFGSSGIAWGDYNADGLLDAANVFEGVTVYQNDGDNGFVEQEIVPHLFGAWSSVWADVDGDGDLDLMTGSGGSHPAMLLENVDGTGFVSTGNPVFSQLASFMPSMAWFDHEGDGDMDLLLSEHVEDGCVRLIKQLSPGVFEEEVLIDWSSRPGRGYTFAMADYDNDRDMDVIVNVIDAGSILLIGDGTDGFTEQALGDWGVDIETSAASWGDYDNDARIDLVVHEYQAGRFYLLRNLGDGSLEVARSWEEPEMTATDLDWGDLDNDGWIDLVSSNISGVGLVYRSDGGGNLLPYNPADLSTHTYMQSSSFVDANADGRLDISMSSFNTAGVLLNNRPGENNWIRITLESEGHDARTTGARVELTSNGVTQVRECRQNNGRRSSVGSTVAFGLGTATSIERVKVFWVGGESEEFSVPAINQTVILTEGEAIGVPEIPRSFALWQNRPNPFNPATEIAFDLPGDDHVTLTIYDVRGRRVVKLAHDEPYLAGRHSITWVGDDARGRRCASGVYFYRLETPHHSATKRMLLIK